LNPSRLVELRKAKGWTQWQLAKAAGLHIATVSEAERGYKESKLSTLEALARALGVQVSDLLGEPEGAATFP
jgi:transcriptional regulator with XRE-family HTH domain